MKILLSFFIISFTFAFSTTYESLYKQSAYNHTLKKIVKGFLNIFDPSMAIYGTSGSKYIFSYKAYGTSGNNPSFSFASSMKYYKFYIPKGVSYLSISGTSYPSNSSYEIYLSRNPDFNTDNAIDAGSSMISPSKAKKLQDPSNVLKVSSNQGSVLVSSDVLSEDLNIGWIYVAIKYDTLQGGYSSATSYSFDLRYDMEVLKSTYDSWRTTVAADSLGDPIGNGSSGLSISPPSTAFPSVKACSGSGSYTSDYFTATGGNDYQWTKDSGDGEITSSGDKANIKYNYDKILVKTYSTKIKVTSSSQSKTANYTFSVKPNLEFSVQDESIAISAHYKKEFENLLSCKVSQSNRKKITWDISIKDQVGNAPEYDFDSSTGVLKWTPSLQGTYQISITAKAEGENSVTKTYNAKVTKPVPPIFNSTPNIALTTNKINTYDLNNLLENNVTQPVEWYVIPKNYSEKIKDFNITTGILTMDDSEDLNMTLTVIATNAKIGGGQNHKTIDLNITSIDPVLIKLKDSVGLYAVAGSNFMQDLTLKYKKDHTVWTATYFYNESNNGININHSTTDDGIQIMINNLKTGKYKVIVNAIDTENYSATDSKSYDTETLNFTVKDKIKISDDINITNVDIKHVSGDKITIKFSEPSSDDSKLILSFEKGIGEDYNISKFTFDIKLDDVAPDYDKNNTNISINLNSIIPADEEGSEHNLSIKVRDNNIDGNEDNKSYVIRVYKNKQVVQEDYAPLKESYNVPNGKTLKFKALTKDDNDKCEFTKETSESISNDCTYVVNFSDDKSSYKLSTQVVNDANTSIGVKKDVTLKKTENSDDITPIIMYLLN